MAANRSLICTLFFTLFFAHSATSDWSDLPGIKSREAGEKVKSRTGKEVDKKVDSTVNCVFNPAECAKKMKGNDEAKPESAKTSAPRPAKTQPRKAPPRPPSADRAKAGPPPPPSARTWYVDVGGGETREVDEGELAQMIRQGDVGSSTPVWTDTFGSDYKAAGEVSQLRRYFSGN